MDTKQLTDDHAAPERLSGVMFLVLAAQFLTVIMLGASLATGYDFRGGAISDLGVAPASALLFNASLVVVGVLNIVGGYLFYRAHRRKGLLALYVLAGLGAVGAAAFPLDQGDLHSIFAVIAFVFFNLQAVGTAFVVIGPMRWISAVAGAVGLVFVALMIVGDGGNSQAFGAIGHGGTERMIVYPVMLWLLALGGYLLSGPAGEASPAA